MIQVECAEHPDRRDNHREISAIVTDEAQELDPTTTGADR